jgi:hypothetical protein
VFNFEQTQFATPKIITIAHRDSAHKASGNRGNDVSSAEEYRIRAAECRQQAARSINVVDKESWLRIAEDWMNLAQSCEQPAAGAMAALALVYGRH